MQGLMQDVPLSLDVIFRRGEQLWPTKRLVTATASGLDATSARGPNGPGASAECSTSSG